MKSNQPNQTKIMKGVGQMLKPTSEREDGPLSITGDWYLELGDQLCFGYCVIITLFVVWTNQQPKKNK